MQTATRAERLEQLASRVHDMPPAYRANTSAETALLDFVDDFAVFFHRFFPDRRPLLLSALNECQTRKMICSFVRPTLVKYDELFDLTCCARFVADYMRYEPLCDVRYYQALQRSESDAKGSISDNSTDDNDDEKDHGGSEGKSHGVKERQVGPRTSRTNSHSLNVVLVDAKTLSWGDRVERLPRQILSPCTALQWQVGNCLEMSLVLTSLLRGAGYHALVVVGYAAPLVCINDQRHRLWPEALPAETNSDDEEAGAVALDAEYAALLVPPPHLRNTTDPEPTQGTSLAGTLPTALTPTSTTTPTNNNNNYHGEGTTLANAGRARGSVAASNEDAATAAAPSASHDASPQSQDRKSRSLSARLQSQSPDMRETVTSNSNGEGIASDGSHGDCKAVHCWVVVLPGGRQSMKAVTFVEPATGACLTPSESGEDNNNSDARYYGIESVFDEQRYYINLHPGVAPSALNYDLNDLAQWEPLLPSTWPAGADEETMSFGNSIGFAATRRNLNSTIANAATATAASNEAAMTATTNTNSITNLTGAGGGNSNNNNNNNNNNNDAAALTNAVLMSGASVSRMRVQVPRSWCLPLTLAQRQYETRYPGGYKEVHYANALVRLYAAYSRPDLRVKEVLQRAEGTNEMQVHVFYAHRADKLRRRSLYHVVGDLLSAVGPRSLTSGHSELSHTTGPSSAPPASQLPNLTNTTNTNTNNTTTATGVSYRRLHEWYDRGRMRDTTPEGLREFIYDVGQSRTMKFYWRARPDGMYRRTELFYTSAQPCVDDGGNEEANDSAVAIGLRKVKEYYRGREDRLCYRSASFARPQCPRARQLHARLVAFDDHNDWAELSYHSPLALLQQSQNMPGNESSTSQKESTQRTNAMEGNASGNEKDSLRGTNFSDLRTHSSGFMQRSMNSETANLASAAAAAMDYGELIRLEPIRMSQRFTRNEVFPAAEDVAKTTFLRTRRPTNKNEGGGDGRGVAQGGHLTHYTPGSGLQQPATTTTTAAAAAARYSFSSHHKSSAEGMDEGDGGDDGSDEAAMMREMWVFFHYSPGSVVRPYHMFAKPASSVEDYIAATATKKAAEAPVRVVTTPNAPAPTALQLHNERKWLNAAETKCAGAIRTTMTECLTILRSMRRDHTRPRAVLSVYDTLRNRPRETEAERAQKLADEARREESRKDYLAPYIAKLPLPSTFNGDYTQVTLTLEQAKQVRDEALHELKERLIQRGHIMQNRMDQEKEHYNEQQLLYQKNSEAAAIDGTKEANDFAQYCKEATWRMKVLDERLSKHIDYASDKYAQLAQKLSEDVRLAALYNNGGNLAGSMTA